MPRVYPSASHPFLRTSLVGFITASSVFTPRRAHTPSIVAWNPGPEIPGIPWARSHSSRVNFGGRRHVIQFIAVPPPAVRPWRMPDAELFDVTMPSGTNVASDTGRARLGHVGGA